MRHQKAKGMPPAIIIKILINFGKLAVICQIVMTVSNVTIKRVTTNQKTDSDKSHKIYEANYDQRA